MRFIQTRTPASVHHPAVPYTLSGRAQLQVFVNIWEGIKLARSKRRKSLLEKYLWTVSRWFVGQNDGYRAANGACCRTNSLRGALSTTIFPCVA